MAFWSSVSQKLKEIMQTMIGARTIEQTLKVAPVISNQMEHAIQLWSDMYKDQSPWLHEPEYADPARVTSLGLPSLIASEKARTALIEFESEITTPTIEVKVQTNVMAGQEEQDEKETNEFTLIKPREEIKEKPVSDTARAEYMNRMYQKLKKQLRTQIEYGVAKGGLVIKPYIVMTNTENALYFENSATDKEKIGVTTTAPTTGQTAEIEFDFIQADAFYPLAFDNTGKITEAAFIQTKTVDNTIYRRLEYHKFENNLVRIVNRAFKSSLATKDSDMTGLDLGQEVPLSEIPEWKDLQTDTIVNNVGRPLFAYFKMPEANTVDTNSPLGVSGFSRAVNLIKDADMQYSRLLWEYEAGEMAVNVDRDAFKWLEDRGDSSRGQSVLGTMQQRLYRQVDVENDDLFEPYAPVLRDVSYTAGLNAILMRIEDVTGLSRGTLADPSEEARTATELKQLKQRTFQTNQDIQTAIQACLEDVIYVMNAYCDLYDITPEGKYDVKFEWDDSILVDADQELNKRLSLMNHGLVSKLENRMWYFGETERQAQEALLKIDEENMSEMEQNLYQQMQLGMTANEINEEGARDRKAKDDKVKSDMKKEEKDGGE